MKLTRRHSVHLPGFTLVEVVVAVGVVATALLAVIGLTGSAVQTASENRDRDAALRLRSAVDQVLQASGQYQEIYGAIRSGTPIYVYCYGSDTGASSNPDGTSAASPDTDFLLADHHTNIVRLSSNPTLDAEWKAAQIVFRVEISPFDPINGEPVDPSDSARMPADPFALDPARLGAKVTLFKLPPSVSAPADMPTGVPITTFNTILRP